MATATASAPTKATYRQLYIDGKWADAAGGKTLGVINPATEETIAEVAYGSRATTASGPSPPPRRRCRRG